MIKEAESGIKEKEKEIQVNTVKLKEDKFNEKSKRVICQYEAKVKIKEGSKEEVIETSPRQEKNQVEGVKSSEEQSLIKGTESEIEESEKAIEVNAGKLIIDATVAPADIKYPTDIDLLNSSREQTEELIDNLYEQGTGKIKPRTYREKARKDYLGVIKQRKKSIKTIRKSIRKQLGYINRNIKTIDRLLDEKPQEFKLENNDLRKLLIIREVYRQQEYMYREKVNTISDRIVSIHQPHVRPIVRGKSGAMVEFGAKISVSLVNKFIKPHQISWDAYNEGGDLQDQVGNYKKEYGYYPSVVIADKIYGTKANREYLRKKGIKFSGKKLGRPKVKTDEIDKKEQKEFNQLNRERNQVEGKFGEGKRRYGLDRIKAKKSDTSESWISAIFFVMNIAVLYRNIFLSFFQLLHIIESLNIKMKKSNSQPALFYLS
jgi:Transposase DDE domain.